MEQCAGVKITSLLRWYWRSAACTTVSIDFAVWPPVPKCLLTVAGLDASVDDGSGDTTSPERADGSKGRVMLAGGNMGRSRDVRT